jgi:hypothetical protein
MKKIARNFLAGMVALGLAGCAVITPQPQASQKPAPTAPKLKGPTWKPETLLAWPKGYTGGPVAYDMATGAKQFELPMGRADALGMLYFAALTDNDETRIKTYTLHDGKEVGSATMKGTWEVSGVSFNGKFVAVTRQPNEDERQAWTKQNTWRTNVRILDAHDGQMKHTLNLDGSFDVETISGDGHHLFLLEHLPAIKPDHYNVRLFDLQAERMNEYPLREKGNDEVMAGYAHDVVASTDGEWLMTLYLNSNKKEAFVHALLLNIQYPVCIDLPSDNGDLNVLQEYRLVLSADNKRLYAANAALGVVVEIALNAGSDPLYQVLHTTTFDGLTPGAGNPSLFTHSAFSADGKTLYFTSNNRAWAYDIAAHKVTTLPAEGALFGIGLSGDGQRLLINREQSLLVFDATSGAALSFPVASR